MMRRHLAELSSQQAETLEDMFLVRVSQAVYRQQGKKDFLELSLVVLRP